MKTALAIALLIIAAGAALALRLPDLARRPMHQDEAIHAYKFKTLFETGRYTYDPFDYHGPTLNYFTLPVTWLTRVKDFAATSEATYRVVPVAFGVGLVLLLLLVTDGLGRAAAVAAGVLTAVSPAMVFYSRYYIQEMLLVFFTFAAVACGWRYIRGRRMVWAVLAGVSVGLMHATKETAVIAWAAMVVGLVGAWVWGRSGSKAEGVTEGDNSLVEATVSRNRKRDAVAVAVALVVAAGVSVLFFSAFDTNWSGPAASIRTYVLQIQRAGDANVHAHPWNYYLGMLAWSHYPGGPIWTEGLILLLAAAGLFAAVTGRGVGQAGSLAFPRFLAVYTVAMTVAYSALRYKTPWCLLGFLHGMILLAGVGAVAVVQAVRVRLGQVVACAVLAGLAGQLGWQAWRASFVFPADNRNPYAYAQVTAGKLHPDDSPGVRELADQVERLSKVYPSGRNTTISVIGIPDDVWPLMWYLRRHNQDRIGCYASLPPEDPSLSLGQGQEAEEAEQGLPAGPDPFAAQIIVASEDLADEVDKKVEASHILVEQYELRPGVFVGLLMKVEL